MTARIRLILIISLGLFTAILPAGAQAASNPARETSAASAASDKIDISAEDSLEWYKEKHLYVARGGARAIKGDMTVEADLLTAKQRDPNAPKTPAQTGTLAYLTAEGHVKIFDPKQQIFGDKAVYDMDTKIMKVTGQDLKYITSGNVVTAKDSLEYFDDKMMAVARGQAIAEHNGDRMQADVLSAFFVRDSAGQNSLDHMQAHGHVTVVTKDGAVTRGEKGYYDAKNDIAYLMGNVRLTQGETQLAGDKAEVNFKSGESRLLSGGGGRVRALLPSSNTDPNANGHKDAQGKKTGP